MTQAVLASGNSGKLRELSNALADLDITLVAQSDLNVSEAPETAVTFIENALLKARNASLATGMPALADDSGLTVDALQGAPGIYSARYAEVAGQGKPTDADNIAKLLAALTDVPTAQRTARFVCALVWLQHANDPEPFIASASWNGRITNTAHGSSGFGYDPVFYCPHSGMTAAELGSDGKRAISHRGKALVALRAQLQARFN